MLLSHTVRRCVARHVEAMQRPTRLQPSQRHSPMPPVTTQILLVIIQLSSSSLSSSSSSNFRRKCKRWEERKVRRRAAPKELSLPPTSFTPTPPSCSTRRPTSKTFQRCDSRPMRPAQLEIQVGARIIRVGHDKTKCSRPSTHQSLYHTAGCLWRPRGRHARDDMLPFLPCRWLDLLAQHQLISLSQRWVRGEASKRWDKSCVRG